MASFNQTLLAFVAMAHLAYAGSLPTSAQEHAWWQFRGPAAGHVANSKVPTTWDGLLNKPLWQTMIPGKGWSSPIVIGDRIWLTTAEEQAMDADKAAERLDRLPKGAKDIVADAAVTLLAIEVNAETGELLRRIELFERQDPQPIHVMNSYASATPATDGTRIVCHFGALGTACIDAQSGEILWQRQVVVDELTGNGASPVLWNDLVFLAFDGSDKQFMLALDKHTGETKWQVDRPAIKVVDDAFRRAFSTPIVIECGNRTQLISLAAQWLISYNPVDGKEWWRARIGDGYSQVPTPVYDRGRIFACTGFTAPELVAVDANGHGDISETGILWRYSRQVPEVSTPIVVGDEIYFGSSNGIITCLQTSDGKMLWQHRTGGNFSASPVHAANRIYFTTTSGVTTVIQPSREYTEVAVNELFGETFASLVPYQSSFLLRTNPYLFRISEQPAIDLEIAK